MKRADRGDAGSVSGTSGSGFRVPGSRSGPGSWFLVGSTFGNRRNPPGTKQRGARYQPGTWNPKPGTRATRMQSDLFGDEPVPPSSPAHVPLAERMRPRSFDDIVGQQDVLGPGRPLREAIERDRLQSIILWGPPGTGKTTIARLVAERTKARFVSFSAVLAGIKDIKEVMAAAEGGTPRARASARSCSWTRSTASTRRSRTRSCRTSRRARSCSSARRRRTRRSR